MEVAKSYSPLKGTHEVGGAHRRIPSHIPTICIRQCIGIKSNKGGVQLVMQEKYKLQTIN